MNLLQINVTANSGSTGRIAEGIGNAAQQAGFDSWIAYGQYANPSSSNLIKIGSKIDHYGHALETRLFDNHGLASSLSTTLFLKKVDMLKPDLIHLHNIHGYYINYEKLIQYIREKSISVVWTIHDCWPFTGHCSYFASCKCERWKNECHNCPQKKTYPISLLCDRSSKNFSTKKESFSSVPKMTLVSVSQWLDRLISQSFFKNCSHTYIYNGINTETFSPISSNICNKIRSMLGIQQDEMMLLGVASVWSNRKGLEDYIELSKRLPSQYRVVLIGLTQKQIKNLPSNIIGLKRTESTQQLAEYYSASDVVLNLSREETFGLTTVEGFSCGTPGIGYDCTATPELFTPDTGFIVSPGDYSRLIECINTIKRNGKQFYFTACRNHALAHFRQEDRFQDYINLYKQILHM